MRHAFGTSLTEDKLCSDVLPGGVVVASLDACAIHDSFGSGSRYGTLVMWCRQPP